MQQTVADVPGFVDPENGRLELRRGAPAGKMKRKLQPISLKLINSETPFTVKKPIAAGAWQGEDRLRLGVTVPGFEIDPIWLEEVDVLDEILNGPAVS